jgi:CheY-like chemotaxis protein
MSDRHPTRDDTKKTLLIVEDEERLAEAIATTVSLEGLETIIASGGKEALSLARKLHPDLLLLDVMLPGMSGSEVCATLKTDPLDGRDPLPGRSWPSASRPFTYR